MKNGFALLVALVFVAFVAAMGAIYLKQVAEVQKLGLSAASIAQKNALTTDAISILSSQAGLVNSGEALSVFLTSVANISYDGDDYKLEVVGESLQNKIPFSKCGFEANESAMCPKILDTILKNYGLSADGSLLSVFANAQSSQTPANSLAFNDSSFTSAKTVSYARFIKIIDYYSYISKNDAINKINWLDYFTFSNYGDSFLDCENMPPKLWSVISQTYSLSYPDCASFLKKEPNSKLISELNLKNFKNNDPYAVKFTITLRQNNASLGKIALYYDIGAKRTLAVEAF